MPVIEPYPLLNAEMNEANIFVTFLELLTVNHTIKFIWRYFLGRTKHIRVR